jgi:hypothetical protein
VEECLVVTVLFCDLAGFTARSDQAGTGWQGLGVVLEHAQALLGLGRCATRLGHRSARDPLDEAAELFGQLRAPGLLAETGHWRLQAAGS